MIRVTLAGYALLLVNCNPTPLESNRVPKNKKKTDEGEGVQSCLHQPHYKIKKILNSIVIKVNSPSSYMSLSPSDYLNFKP